ncbi:Hypothetical protein SRAE_X000168400 [Strongyloides ratti]|uniref:Uncharacterized protein n=1 Tax=Strongyloides ratti TaxID=34506 RepID=A0A090MPB5_STRRB|nr:Hypothetical protein SRAE_X000168400 [Strongyloides ratti]CEF59941.2 Hypothetical protein SRAE_X000168400 [Strongyloides ratti]
MIYNEKLIKMKFFQIYIVTVILLLAFYHTNGLKSSHFEVVENSDDNALVRIERSKPENETNNDEQNDEKKVDGKSDISDATLMVEDDTTSTPTCTGSILSYIYDFLGYICDYFAYLMRYFTSFFG